MPGGRTGRKEHHVTEGSLTQFGTVDGVYRAPGGPQRDTSGGVTEIQPTGLRLTDSRVTAGGGVISTYRNAGAPRYGDFTEVTAAAQ
ncbi:hypothetical protein [Nocardia sp. R6R-6]|uniref:hypothetical protein n=1 Tax=Nocardia sp. R6R-6 TaxID=3459303 RepID=UPI00403DB59A